jgi:hypothetical protein
VRRSIPSWLTVVAVGVWVPVRLMAVWHLSLLAEVFLALGS